MSSSESKPLRLVVPPSETGPCPPSRAGIAPNVSTASDKRWAQSILDNPASSDMNRARAQQILSQ